MQSFVGLFLGVGMVVGATYLYHVKVTEPDEAREAAHWEKIADQKTTAEKTRARTLVTVGNPRADHVPTSAGYRVEGYEYQVYPSIDYSPKWATCPNAWCNPQY